MIFAVPDWNNIPANDLTNIDLRKFSLTCVRRGYEGRSLIAKKGGVKKGVPGHHIEIRARVIVFDEGAPKW